MGKVLGNQKKTLSGYWLLVTGYSCMRRGFMLLEVVLSILIVGGGIVFVTQSYLTSLRSAEVAKVMARACFILEDKLFSLEIKGFADGLKESEAAGAVDDNEGYSWGYAACPIDESEKIKINKVDLKVSYKKGTLKRDIGVSTLLKYKE